MWMVVYYVIGTHQLSSLPPSIKLTQSEAWMIAHSLDNYKFGVYGVMKPMVK